MTFANVLERIDKLDISDDAKLMMRTMIACGCIFGISILAYYLENERKEIDE